MKRLTNEQLSFLLQFPTGHRLQVGALSYIDTHNIQDVDILFEAMKATQDIIGVFNKKLGMLDEKKRKQCTIYPTDSGNQIRKKCRRAYVWGIHYAPVWNRYVQPEPTTPEPDTGGADVGDGGDVGGDAGGVEELKGLAGSKFTYPMSSGPEDDYQLKPQDEALSSTERMRRFNKRHPEKVRQYLKKTQNDRVARNRDRAKAVKKHGKAKMKNHDVHHPNGAQNGNWKLAKKDHGRDKKNEEIQYVFFSELIEGNVPNGRWALINEGGAHGHLAHPFEDTDLSFSDFDEMLNRALVGNMQKEGPVVEKMDGQNIAFTVRDGKVVFARNKGHLKNRAENALSAEELAKMFADRGEISDAFSKAAEDIGAAMSKLSPKEIENVFGNGRRVMSTEIIYPGTRNVIPYDKTVLVFHGTLEHDDDGEKVGVQNTEAGSILSTAVTTANADKQKTFGISGPRTVAISDQSTKELEKVYTDVSNSLDNVKDQYALKPSSTLHDYLDSWWNEKLNDIEVQNGVKFTNTERDGLVKRWVDGDKQFGVKHLSDDKKEWFRNFEATELKQLSKQSVKPFEQAFLKAGVYSLKRVVEFLSANNPAMATQLKKEFLETVSQIRDTSGGEKLDKLEFELARLKELGMDSVVPTEGLIFTYNGNPYKLTGTFAPVNQIMGVLKYDKTPKPVKEPEEKPQSTEQPPQDTPSAQPSTPIAIYPGRFQPYHAGHQVTYDALVNKFGKDNVYVVSSDKQDSISSPFSFAQKKEIMTNMFGIPEDKVIQVKNPYNPTELTEKLPKGTPVIFAVGEKDAERLRGKYFQTYDPDKKMSGYEDAGYVWVGPPPNLTVNGVEISGTQLRTVMGNPKITDDVKKEIFTMIYGKFDPDIFKNVVKVTTGSEEARELTSKHGKPSPKKKAQTPAPKQQLKQKPADTDVAPKDVSFYQPGETWQTVGGNFGGKNKKNQIKYFGTKEKANIFATK